MLLNARGILVAEKRKQSSLVNALAQIADTAYGEGYRIAQDDSAQLLERLTKAQLEAPY